MPIDKSKFKDVITAHFAALKGQSFEVPGWKLTIHHDPLTVRERDELDRLECGENEFHVMVLIRKAKDADGNPLFTQADVGWLVRDAAPSLIRYAAVKIMTADLVEPERLGEPSAPKTEP